MAKFPFFRSDSDGGRTGPFSRHPAFPIVVAVWFAALLGIGSLLLPAVLFERFADKTGIVGLVPAAAPPLGMKARLLIALGSSVLGALLGLSIARRVASAHASPAEARLSRLDPDARKPVSVREEIEFEEPEGRDLRAFLVPFTPAPPHAEPETVVEADWELVPELIPPSRLQQQVESEAEAYVEPEADTAAEAEFEPVEVAAPAIDWRTSDQPYEGPEMTDVQDAWTDPDLGQWQYPVEPEAEAEFEPVAEDDFEPEAIDETTAEAGEDVMEAEAAPELAKPEYAEPEYVEPAFVPPMNFTIDPDLPSLDELPLPELVQRLAATIEKRREWIAASRAAAAAAAAAAEAERARPAAFEAAPAEEAAQAMAAWFSSSGQGFVHAQTPAPEWSEPVGHVEEAAPVLLRPAFLDWFEHGEDDEDEFALPSLNLPRREPIALAPVFDPESEEVEAEAEAEAAIEDEEAYGSLIGMKNPFAPPRSDFIRIDEEDALEVGAEDVDSAEYPQERPDIMQTDAALRAALASLQRISGAA